MKDVTASQRNFKKYFHQAIREKFGLTPEVELFCALSDFPNGAVGIISSAEQFAQIIDAFEQINSWAFAYVFNRQGKCFDVTSHWRYHRRIGNTEVINISSALQAKGRTFTAVLVSPAVCTSLDELNPDLVSAILPSLHAVGGGIQFFN